MKDYEVFGLILQPGFFTKGRGSGGSGPPKLCLYTLLRWSIPPKRAMRYAVSYKIMPFSITQCYYCSKHLPRFYRMFFIVFFVLIDQIIICLIRGQQKDRGILQVIVLVTLKHLLIVGLLKYKYEHFKILSYFFIELFQFFFLCGSITYL